MTRVTIHAVIARVLLCLLHVYD